MSRASGGPTLCKSVCACVSSPTHASLVPLQSGKDGRGAQKIFFIVQKGAQKKREGAHNNAAMCVCLCIIERVDISTCVVLRKIKPKQSP